MKKGSVLILCVLIWSTRAFAGNLSVDNLIVVKDGTFYGDITLSRAEVPTNGLVAYYPFDGDVNDESDNGNNGTEYGGLSYVTGVVNSAVSFDGVDDWIKIASSSELEMATNSFSIIFWVKTSFTDYQMLFYKGNHATTSGKKWYLCDLRSGMATGGVDDNVYKSQSLSGDANLSYNDEQWHQFVFIRDMAGGTLNFYKDGMLDYTFPDHTVNSIANSDRISIGKFRDGDENFFTGTMDEMRIYARALSPTEIIALYVNPGGLERGGKSLTVEGSFIAEHLPPQGDVSMGSFTEE